MGATVGTEHNYFSGTDEARLADLQAMMDDPKIDAIYVKKNFVIKVIIKLETMTIEQVNL